MPKREIALVALFHVRWRPLYCKQLRASLFGLSALAYFPPSLATACHKETSVANNTEVATVFFVSLRVSDKLFSMQASFLSPPPHFRGPFFLSSAVPLSGPYWEDRDRHSAQPKVCLPVWSAWVWDKSALTLPTHSKPPPKTSSQQTRTFSPNSSFSVIFYLPQLLLTKHSVQRSFFVFYIGYIANPGHFKCMFITI